MISPRVHRIAANPGIPARRDAAEKAPGEEKIEAEKRCADIPQGRAVQCSKRLAFSSIHVVRVMCLPACQKREQEEHARTIGIWILTSYPSVSSRSGGFELTSSWSLVTISSCERGDDGGFEIDDQRCYIFVIRSSSSSSSWKDTRRKVLDSC
jgi:hypothetical protein